MSGCHEFIIQSLSLSKWYAQATTQAAHSHSGHKAEGLLQPESPTYVNSPSLKNQREMEAIHSKR